MNTGPSIDCLLRRLSETPADFLAEPRIGELGEVVVSAVVGDLLRALGREVSIADVVNFHTKDSKHRNWLRLVLIASWLAYDPWFREARLHAPMHRWLETGLQGLAKFVSVEQFVTDPDRSEELARLLLDATGILPEGETKEQARDRLDTVDTVARVDVVARMKEQRERARKLREAMETQRAREAAARVSRE